MLQICASLSPFIWWAHHWQWWAGRTLASVGRRSDGELVVKQRGKRRLKVRNGDSCNLQAPTIDKSPLSWLILRLVVHVHPAAAFGALALKERRDAQALAFVFGAAVGEDELLHVLLLDDHRLVVVQVVRLIDLLPLLLCLADLLRGQLLLVAGTTSRLDDAAAADADVAAASLALVCHHVPGGVSVKIDFLFEFYDQVSLETEE